MRLVVVGGGTGGHLFPGIAVARGLQARLAESRVLFIGTERLVDQQNLVDQGFELATLACGGVKGLGGFRRIHNLLRLPGAVLAALRLLRDFRPDLVFGVGGYVTGPVLVAARLLRVPVAIHEQNSVPGLANRLAGRLADMVCISLPCIPPFPAAKTLITGNPVRQEILEAAGKPKPDGHTLVVLGGSQGAHRLNMLILEVAPRLAEAHPELAIIHQTGQADQAEAARRYADCGIRAEAHAFIRDMAAVYRQATLAVSRAGATTLAELAVMGVPALLIPYPFAADDHQTTNGEYYAKAGGCKLFAQSGLNAEILFTAISEHLQNKEELHTMSANMKARAMPDATDRIVDACIRLTNRRGVPYSP